MVKSAQVLFIDGPDDAGRIKAARGKQIAPRGMKLREKFLLCGRKVAAYDKDRPPPWPAVVNVPITERLLTYPVAFAVYDSAVNTPTRFAKLVAQHFEQCGDSDEDEAVASVHADDVADSGSESEGDELDDVDEEEEEAV
jgi:hypothetical protein